MKICLIGGIYNKGGVRSAYVNSTPETTLEEGLCAAGHDVTTLSHYDDVPFDRFDVVHVHHLSYGAARLASDDSGTPFVFTAHDASHMNGSPLGGVRQLAMRYVLSRADGIVSLFRKEADFQRAGYPTQGALLETIPNGIVALRFPLIRTNSAGNNAPWRLLFVGQLIPLKGCHMLLDAMARMSLPIELTLAYQTNTLEPQLKEQARRLGILERAHFIGRQDSRQLAALYQRSDLLILPSATEALPSVITEAMLSGLPFVASAVGGIPEQAAGFGFLLHKRTVEDLAAAIDNVLRHYPEFARTAQAMRTHAQATFSVEAMVQKHVTLYEQLSVLSATRRTGKSFVDRVVRTALRFRSRGASIRNSSETPALTER